MRTVRTLFLGLLLAAFVHKSRAQTTAAPQAYDAPIIGSEGSRHDYDELLIELSADHRRTLNRSYESLTQGVLSGLYSLDPHNSVGVSLGFGAFQLGRGSFADFIARQPFFFEPGLIGRHYFTAPHVFLRPYATASLNLIWAIWDYRNPMPVGKDTVSTDSIEGFDASAGFGLAIQMSENFNLFAEVNGGGFVFPCETIGGVHNNFFDNSAYVGVKAGLSLSF